MPNLNVHNTVYDLAKNTENLDELKKKLGTLHIDAFNNDIPMHTAAGRLALEGNHKAVKLLEQLGASPLGIVRGYAARRLQKKELIENEKILADYLKLYPRFRFQIMWTYAANGLNELVEEFYSKHPDTIANLLSGYAYADNRMQIKRYRGILDRNTELNVLALGYASGGHALCGDLQMIRSTAIGFIMGGKYSLVAQNIKESLPFDHYIATLLAQLGYDELVLKHETIDENAIGHALLQKERIEAIVLGYLYGNNWVKVEEYRIKYSVPLQVIKNLYRLAYDRNGITALNTETEQTAIEAPATVSAIETSESSFNFDQARDKLSKLMGQLDEKAVCSKLIKSMDRLKQGQDTYLNPYWIGSEAKLSKIINALRLINTIEDLIKNIENPQSELYRAVNTQRLLPITFLGQFAYNKAKTLINIVEQEVNLSSVPN